MALNDHVVDTVGAPLTDAQLPVLEHRYKEPRLRNFIEFARATNGLELKRPNHIEGVPVDKRPLNVRQIVGVPRPDGHNLPVMTAAHPGWYGTVARVASIAFGGYIAVTSGVLIFVGFSGWGGWLSIIYGLLGIATGLAGIAATFVNQPLRSALFGWFLVGVAFRSILDGSVYLVFFTVPFALILLGALVVELATSGKVANWVAGIGAGAAAILAIFVLSAVAPYLPAICPPSWTGVYMTYPGNEGFWDGAQSKVEDVCRARGLTQ